VPTTDANAIQRVWFTTVGIAAPGCHGIAHADRRQASFVVRPKVAGAAVRIGESQNRPPEPLAQLRDAIADLAIAFGRALRSEDHMINGMTANFVAFGR